MLEGTYVTYHDVDELMASSYRRGVDFEGGDRGLSDEPKHSRPKHQFCLLDCAFLVLYDIASVEKLPIDAAAKRSRYSIF